MNLQSLIWLAKTLLGLAKHLPAKKHLPVLLVEDSPLDAHLIQMVLQRQGVDSVVATSLGTARDLLRYRRFRMVIMDIVFPVGNGVDFANEIYPDFPELPVMFLTGHLPEIVVAPGMRRTLSAGRVWTMSAKGVESGSLEHALRQAIKSANGVNGDIKPSELFVVAWVLCTLSACVGFGVAYFLNVIKP